VRYENEPVAGRRNAAGRQRADVAKRVKEKMAELAPTFPAGVSWQVVFDSTTFIIISIREVMYTLIAAVVLVFIVMLVFLQSIRATLIPTLVVPAALMGAFVGMYAAGFSINQLSLFGMVAGDRYRRGRRDRRHRGAERIMRWRRPVAARGDAQGHGPDHGRDRDHHGGARRISFRARCRPAPPA
jgi:hypothetical protein